MKGILYQIKKIDIREVNVLSFVISMLALHYMVGGIPVLSNIILFFAYLIGLFEYIWKRGVHIEYKWLLLLLYLPLTILIANPNPVFKSWERLLLFTALFLFASPVIQSEFARKLRVKCLNICLIICIALSVGSFVGYFGGINLFSYELSRDYIGVAGMFSGLTRQSMILGPISGISTIFLFYKMMVNNEKLYLLLLIPCIGCVFFASSRSAFGATLFGILVTMYLYLRSSVKMIRKLLPIGIILIATFPLWESVTLALQDKQKLHSGRKETFDSRSGKIEARWNEFISNPIIGVGFAAINSNGKDPYNRKTGTVEPGSSWLCILSMTGIIGFIMVSLLMFGSFNVIKQNKELAWLSGVFSFFCIHMLVEGYVFAAGNSLTFILWLVIGNSFDKKYI